MRLEDISYDVGKIVWRTWALAPAWLLAAIICFWYRDRRWTPSFWALMIGPVVGLLGLLTLMIVGTASLARSPDSGWAGMATTIETILAMPLLLAGGLLLASCPPPRVWSWRAIPWYIAVLAVSCTAFVAVVRATPRPFLPPHTVELIVADGFRGLIEIRPSVDGTWPKRGSGLTYYEIPATGKLETTDAAPFDASHTDSARYVNGVAIPHPNYAAPSPQKLTQVCFFSLGGEGETLQFFIGTIPEFEAWQQKRYSRRANKNRE